MWLFVVTFVYLVAVPICGYLMFAQKFLRRIAFGSLIFLPALNIMVHLQASPFWRGTAWGYAVNTTDVMASTLIFSLLIDPKIRFKFFPKSIWFYFLYFASCTISCLNAKYMLQSSYEVFKMFWMYVLFLAVYNYFRNTFDYQALIMGTTVTALFLFCDGLYQKYFTAIYQLQCTFNHQNSLALYLEVLGMLLLGNVLNEKSRLSSLALRFIAFGATAILVVYTMSRGGMMFFPLGALVVMAGSLFIDRSVIRVIYFSVVASVFAFMLLLVLLPKIINRFENAPKSSAETRVYLAKAAVRIANDFVIGVGPNNFCEYSSPNYNYAKEQYDNIPGNIRPDKTEDLKRRPLGPNVETIYLLVAAECGWGGLFILLLWFGYVFIQGIRASFAMRGTPYFGLAIGCLGALAANFGQSVFEWVLKQYANFYSLMLIFAILTVLCEKRKEIRAMGNQSAGV